MTEPRCEMCKAGVPRCQLTDGSVAHEFSEVEQEPYRRAWCEPCTGPRRVGQRREGERRHYTGYSQTGLRRKEGSDRRANPDRRLHG